MARIQEIKVPLLSVNDSSLTVVDVMYTNGQPVEKGSVILVFETSKTTYEVQAEADGFIQYYCEAGRDYQVNEQVAVIFSLQEETIQEKSAATIMTENVPTRIAAAVVEESIVQWDGDTVFSKQALHLMEASGLDRNRFSGKDFISLPDVQKKLGIETVSPPAGAVAAKGKLPAATDPLKVVMEKRTAGKKREIDYLSDVQSAGLTSTINTNIETGGLFVHINASLRYFKHSLLPLIIYESARLLKKYPLLNAYYTPEGTALYKAVHIGFAVDIDKGLKVLKLPFTNEKSLSEIEESIMTLSGKYLDDRLELSDLTDISFTITDLSGEGVDFFKPLVNMMNSAILGVSSIDKKLERCTLSITFDHRVTEGKLVAVFLRELKDRLESYRADAIYRTREITCFKCYTLLAEDLTDTGFVHCVQPNGKDGYICQRCLKGF